MGVLRRGGRPARDAGRGGQALGAAVSLRTDRELIKRRRDAEQARLVAGLVNDRPPHLRFDAHDLTALPAAMCRSVEALLAKLPRGDEAAPTGLEPDW